MSISDDELKKLFNVSADVCNLLQKSLDNPIQAIAILFIVMGRISMRNTLDSFQQLSAQKIFEELINRCHDDNMAFFKFGFENEKINKALKRPVN